MNQLLRSLLDLEVIPADAGPIRLAWTHPLPGWVWLAGAGLALLVGLEAYRRMPGSRTLRGSLAACRGLLIVLVLAMLAGPVAELPREDVEPDRVLVLIDRSRSMSVADAEDPDGGGRITRSQQAEMAFRRAADDLAVLGQRKEIRWFGFHEGLFTLGEQAGNSSMPDFGDAPGRRTDLSRAIDQAVQRSGGRPISAILLASDGRATRAVDPALARRLRSEGVPLVVVPLGSREPVGDLAVADVDAPGRAFVRDKVPVRLDMDRLGPALQRTGATVRLVDDLDGTVLDEVRLEPGDDRTSLTLVAEPEVPGETTWTVRIEPDEPDLVPENNVASVAIELVDRPMRVLFVDGYPRWEYRYLKNLLIREESIESSNFLLTADRDFAQEGNAPISRLPRTAEEWQPFDVIVIGDVPAGFFSPEQAERIRDHVADGGAGLLWVGGERSMPATWEDSVLADLLPFTGGTRLPAMGRAVTMEPTPLAERLGVLQLVLGEDRGWPEELRDPAVGWSQLSWSQRIDPDRLKPTAEPLARTVAAVDGSPLPLLVHMRFGAGQVIYSATDEIWRWRYGRGEVLPEQFWIQMIRMLARDRLAAGGEAAVLEVDPPRTEVGRPVQVRVRVLDARLAETRRGSIEAEVVDAAGETLTRLELVPEPGDMARHTATWLPDRAGGFTIRVSGGDLAELGLAGSLMVREPADELLQPETDHPLLERLAAETGGRVLAPDRIGPGLEGLPNREVRTENPLRESIWDTPLAFALLLGLLTLEWLGRRHLRLA